MGKMFCRVFRGMVRHKTARGNAAMERLRVYEGIPKDYANQKRLLVPQAMRATRLQNGRKWCKLGDLMASVGWNKAELVESLENKRKDRAGKWFARRLKVAKAVQKHAHALPEVRKLRD